MGHNQMATHNRRTLPEITPYYQGKPDRLALSIPAAVHAAGISRSFIYAAMKSGGLRSLRIGGRRLIMFRDLEAWLNSFGRSVS